MLLSDIANDFGEWRGAGFAFVYRGTFDELAHWDGTTWAGPVGVIMLFSLVLARGSVSAFVRYFDNLLASARWNEFTHIYHVYWFLRVGLSDEISVGTTIHDTVEFFAKLDAESNKKLLTLHAKWCIIEERGWVEPVVLLRKEEDYER